MPLLDTFQAAERLELVRLTRGESQTAFARQCGVTTTNMGKYLRGELQPGFDVLIRIAERTGVSLDWLLLGEGGTSPRHRGMTRTRASLEADLAVFLSRQLNDAVREGRIPRPLPSRNSADAAPAPEWGVNGRAVLSDAADRVVSAARREHEESLRDQLYRSATRELMQWIPAADREAAARGALARELMAQLGVADPAALVFVREAPETVPTVDAMRTASGANKG
jgi:transcriptional regulator with XRE-family HTH domain